jgi:uncharacterized membrane protein YidH (DUF202 family)
MVNFGTELERFRHEHAQYAEFCASYKEMEEELLELHEQQQGRTVGTVNEVCAEQRRLGALDRNQWYETVEGKFQRIIETELNRVNFFADLQYGRIFSRVRQVLGSSTSPSADMLTEIDAEFVTFTKYLDMNLVAFRKIFKKFDKHFPTRTGSSAWLMSRVKTASFMTLELDKVALAINAAWQTLTPESFENATLSSAAKAVPGETEPCKFLITSRHEIWSVASLLMKRLPMQTPSKLPLPDLKEAVLRAAVERGGVPMLPPCVRPCRAVVYDTDALEDYCDHVRASATSRASAPVLVEELDVQSEEDFDTQKRLRFNGRCVVVSEDQIRDLENGKLPAVLGVEVGARRRGAVAALRYTRLEFACATLYMDIEVANMSDVGKGELAWHTTQVDGVLEIAAGPLANELMQRIKIVQSFSLPALALTATRGSKLAVLPDWAAPTVNEEVEEEKEKGKKGPKRDRSHIFPANVAEAKPMRTSIVRADPRAFFANERTLIDWLHFATILALVALAGTESRLESVTKVSAMLLLVPPPLVLYAAYVFVYRQHYLYVRGLVRYSDTFMPTVVTVFVCAALLFFIAAHLFDLDGHRNCVPLVGESRNDA